MRRQLPETRAISEDVGRAHRFDVGRYVMTPDGPGRIVAYFPARERPEMASYTVKLAKLENAVPFYHYELRSIQ